MAAFSYAALDPNGKEQKGILEADSSRQARQMLRDRGLAPLRVDSAVTSKKPTQGQSATYFSSNSGPSLKVSERAIITRQLATLLRSSMPLEEALLAVSRQTENTRVRSIVSTVRSKVMEGHTLAGSLSEFPKAFSALYRATIAAGEHAGHLDLVLERLADYTEKSHESLQKARLALLYPVLLFVLSVAIVSGLMAFVVPDVVEVFVGQGQQLPLLTRSLIALSDFIVSYGVITLLLIIAMLFGLRVLLSKESVQPAWHKRLLTMPLVGRFSRGSNTARYASTLSILTSSGVPLVDAMDIAAKVVANRWLQNGLQLATQQVREGGSLHQALTQCGYFPPMMIHMIASGEVSGELDNMLERVAESQQRELDNLIATMIGIFEPMMLLVMGGAVLIIVMAILQPIFSLNQLI